MAAKPDNLTEPDRRTLDRVQQATQSEIERYRAYSSAEEVVTNFKRDLTSHAAKKVHADLRQLGLPILNDIRDRFEEKVQSLGIHPRSS